MVICNIFPRLILLNWKTGKVLHKLFGGSAGKIETSGIMLRIDTEKAIKKKKLSMARWSQLIGDINF